MRTPDTSPGSRVLAFGHYQPSQVVTNDDLAATIETDDEWIQSRVGIKERRIAPEGESEVDMAIQAGGKALAASGLAATDIDLVIVATCTSETPGIGPVVWGSACDKYDTIIIDYRASILRQEGQTVFRWATTAMHPVAKEACERAGVDPSELAAFVPHQANLRIIETIARKLGATNAVIARDIVLAGNTSAASIPLALSRMIERGEVRSGGLALLLGFGAGLAYAGQVIEIP